MVSLHPLAGLRPRPDIAQALAAVPYDVLDTATARELARDNPHSFLRISRSELELDPKTDPYSPAVYDHACKNLRKFVREGYLQMESEPSLYIYRLQMGDQIQTGIMGGVTVDDYDAGRIKIHEKTRPDKEDDRVRHILTLRAHAEPVFLAYRAKDDIQRAIIKESSSAPLYNFVAADGIRHTVWKVAEPHQLVQLFSTLQHVYIADGHHRAASASRVTRELRPSEGDTGHQNFLAVLFPHTELKILPYNRVIKKLPREAKTLLNQLAESFQIQPDAAASPKRKGEFALFIDGRWYGLAPKVASVGTDPVAALDVSILYKLALGPIFGIGDERTDKNIDFVGGIHGTKKLEELVQSGTAACAFSLYPVSIEELFSVADKGLMMAPKSTWFEPKLRSGLFVHTF